MEVVSVQIGELKEWEHNARIHTRRNLDALKSSLTEFGQTKPILVQKSSKRIIAGNGTYQAMVALGWKMVDCRMLDLDDTKAEALAIADNRTGLLSEWDEKELTDSLKRLQVCGDLELTGFDAMEPDKMLSFQDGDMFEKISPEKPKEKAKKEDFPQKQEKVPPPVDDSFPEPSEDLPPPADYSEQMSFTLYGFTFTCSDSRQLKELKCLMELLKDASFTERQAVNQAVFDSIESILTEKFMR